MVRVVRRSVLGLLLALAACGVQETGNHTAGVVGSTTPTTLAPESTSTSLRHDTTATVEEGAVIEPDTPNKSFVEEQAIADLAPRLSVERESIKTVSVETGVWSDGSIGCPDPGALYTQALVSGTRVTLVHAATTYLYHQGGSGVPFLCEDSVEGSFTGVEGDKLIPPPRYDE